MKRLAILAFSLGVMVAPFQAHAQKPVEFNGMVFDAPAVAAMRPPKRRRRPRPERPRVNSTATTALTRNDKTQPSQRSAFLHVMAGRVAAHPRLRFDAR